MFVVNATAPERFYEAKQELYRIHDELGHREYWHPLLVVANKMDDGANAAALAKLSLALDLEGLAKRGRIMSLTVIPMTVSGYH